MFLTTRWSVVQAAGDGDREVARAALETLCASTWYPLYAFARREGLGRDDAADAVQSFLARLLDRGDLHRVDRERGRFRTWLLSCFRHHLANERERERAQKRGGGRAPIPIDAAEADARYGREPADGATPERTYRRAWALALLDRAFDALRGEYAGRGQGELFDALRGSLLEDGPAPPRAALAERLGTSEGALNVAAHRLRERFRVRLRAEIAQTVGHAAEVDAELEELFAALGA